MKYFIYKFLFFSFPIIFFLVGFDFFVGIQLAKTNLNEGEFEVWNDIYKGKINADIAIYGSSRAWLHFSPKVIEKKTGIGVYNFGLDGQNFEIQNLRHHDYFENNKRPKIVVFSLDVFTFVKKDKLYNSNQFLPFMYFNSAYYESLKDTKNFNFYDFIIPSVRYFGKYEMIYDLFKSHSYNHFRYKGFKGSKRKWIEMQVKQGEQSSYTVQIDSSLVQKFMKNLLELKNQGIKVIFVYTPEYIDGQNFVTNRKTLLNIYDSISKAEKITFLDYSKDSISYQKYLFYNSEHLNGKGATIFSKKFSIDLLNLINQKL